MADQRYDEAISHYTVALSLDLPSPQGVLIKRSKAYLETELWKQAVEDANQVYSFSPARVSLVDHRQVIALDPSSPLGYETKRVVLHKAGDYDSAVNTLEEMLSKVMESADPDIQRQLYPRYMTR